MFPCVLDFLVISRVVVPEGNSAQSVVSGRKCGMGRRTEVIWRWETIDKKKKSLVDGEGEKNPKRVFLRGVLPY